jgi:hypothetical protein
VKRPWVWRAGVALYLLLNAGGAVFALAMREPMHAAVHVGLLLFALGGYVIWRVAARNRPDLTQQAQLGNERLDYLQQSVDAIALEVERIGEAQRFNEKLRTEPKPQSPPNRETDK